MLSRHEDELRQQQFSYQELHDKLERKEHFLQTKEKKWLEVEKIMLEYIDGDDELRDKLQELRLNIQPETKLSSTVGENEVLKKELAKAYREIDRLRHWMIDPFGKHRQSGTNKHMREKEVVVTPWEIKIIHKAKLEEDLL